MGEAQPPAEHLPLFILKQFIYSLALFIFFFDKLELKLFAASLKAILFIDYMNYLDAEFFHIFYLM